MRTKRATRFNHEREHKEYGIVNWFHLTGINDQQVMKETMANFCITNGFQVTKDTQEKSMVNFTHNRFQKFCPFALNFLRENNYLQ